VHFPRIQVTKTIVELTDTAVHLRFPAKPPSEHRRFLAETGGFRWSPAGFWYHRKTQENVAFAKAIESRGFPDDEQLDGSLTIEPSDNPQPVEQAA